MTKREAQCGRDNKKRKEKFRQRHSKQVEGIQEDELWLHWNSDMQQLGLQLTVPELYPL
jgi:hypothetical protein